MSGDGRGVVGLDLGHRDMNGPLLVRRVAVTGFRVGIATAGAVNSQTFEHVALSGQTEFGLDNQGQAVSIRGLTADAAVPAVRSYGTLCLVDATLTGRGGAAARPAVVNYNGGQAFLRDVATAGYARAVADVDTPDFAAAYRVAGPDKPGTAGPRVAEYVSRPPTSPFPSRGGSLRLAVEETPEFPPTTPSRGPWPTPSGPTPPATATRPTPSSGPWTPGRPPCSCPGGTPSPAPSSSAGGSGGSSGAAGGSTTPAG